MKQAKDYSQKQLEEMMKDSISKMITKLHKEYGTKIFHKDIKERMDKVYFKLNTRLRSTAGRWCYNTKTKEYRIELHPETKQVKNTLDHESLHLLTGLRDNKQFERICKKFGVRFVHYEKFESMTDYKYKATCKGCGSTIKRKRKSRFIKNPELYSCKRCGDKFTVESLEKGE